MHGYPGTLTLLNDSNLWNRTSDSRNASSQRRLEAVVPQGTVPFITLPLQRLHDRNIHSLFTLYTNDTRITIRFKSADLATMKLQVMKDEIEE